MNFTFSIAAFTAILAIGQLFAEESTRPNIIFILTDDQGYGDLEAHGHPYLKTPHLNQLREESVSFENFYVSASCSPTRAALMTGMHEFRNAVTHTLPPRQGLFPEAVTLPDLLQESGYKTGFIGKWHLGHGPGFEPTDRGFDWVSTNQKGPRKHFDPLMIRNGVRSQRTGYREDIYYDEAMAFIQESGEQPFFLYLSTYSPHTPLAAPEKFIKPFRDAGLNDTHATYLAMIENIDYNTGRLMAYLEENKMDGNTIVIFMNDNGVTEGLDVYNAGMRGCKATAWEGGTRAMSFWRWPSKWPAQTRDELTAHLDLLPTLCELAGVEIPSDLQAELEGYSLIPLLEGEVGQSWQHDDRFLFHHVARWPSGMAAAHKYAMAGARQGEYLLVRSDDCGTEACELHQSQCTTMRLVRYKNLTTTTYAKGSAQYHWGVTPKGRWALYNVNEDPGCLNDLSATQSRRVQAMREAYDAWWADVFPIMMARGGDEGDPDVSRRASQQAKSWKGPTSDRAPKATKAVAPKSATLVSSSEDPQRKAFFERLDKDRNEEISLEEYLGHFEKAFARFDADSNGFLEDAERAASQLKGIHSGGGKRVSERDYMEYYKMVFQRRDQNGDGALQISEF